MGGGGGLRMRQRAGGKRLETEVSRGDVTSMTSADTSSLLRLPGNLETVTDYRKHLSRPPVGRGGNRGRGRWADQQCMTSILMETCSLQPLLLIPAKKKREEKKRSVCDLLRRLIREFKALQFHCESTWGCSAVRCGGRR